MNNMNVENFLRNKIVRQIKWNGQEFTFTRYEKDNYGQLTHEVAETFTFVGLFHEGGGYGGMLQVELFERDGGRTITKLKPMILCLYEDGRDLDIDDVVKIGDNYHKLVQKVDVKNLGVAYEMTLELIDER